LAPAFASSDVRPSRRAQLLQGDTIVIEYNGKLYHIDVLEVKPDNAISVVETDVNVDFAPPKDYVEPDYKAEAAAKALADAAAAELAAQAAGGGAGAAGPSKKDEQEPEEPKFLMFGGALSAPSMLLSGCVAMLLRYNSE
jgi:Ubiquitin fusion degradation protein UFD1